MLKPIKQNRVLYLLEQPIQLIVCFRPPQVSQQNISVEVAPEANDEVLPEDACIEILDAKGKVVMLAVACKTPKLVLEFRGERGESFAVRISFHSTLLLQSFTI